MFSVFLFFNIREELLIAIFLLFSSFFASLPIKLISSNFCSFFESIDNNTLLKNKFDKPQLPVKIEL